jgi:SAM-dependent methyltransferase
VFLAAGDIIRDRFFAAYYARVPAPHFSFRGETYQYIYHEYNGTWRNERCVEIPIAMRRIHACRGKRILEVGHVTGHYMPVSHDVIDKYEAYEGVINEDAVSFTTKEPYDLIVSISTLEHVGWDEEPRRPERVLAAFDNLRECLAPEGLFIVTVPLGWNPVLDEHILSGRVRFAETFFMKRDGPGAWREVTREEAYASPYRKEIPSAGAICIGYIRKAT